MKKDEQETKVEVGVKDGQDEASKTPANPNEAWPAATEAPTDDAERNDMPDEQDPERPADVVAATYADPDGRAAVTGVRRPDSYHAEPSSYTPSGARPGQQNPVNPQGSPNADPHALEVGARPAETPVINEGYNGDFVKVLTEGEKNPSQLPVDVEREEYRAGTAWTHNDTARERKMREKRGE